MVRSLYEKEPTEAGKYVIVIFVLFMKIKIKYIVKKIAFLIYFRIECKKIQYFNVWISCRQILQRQNANIVLYALDPYVNT